MAYPGSANKSREFNPNTFLATIGEQEEPDIRQETGGVQAQGDAADAVFYIQKGKVKLTVVSGAGREATLGVLGMGISLAKERWPVRPCVWDLPQP